MYEELRHKAIEKIEKNRKKRKEIQTVGVTFATTSVILFIVSTRLSGAQAFWVRLPIVILALVFLIIYTSEYGLPFFNNDDDDLTDEEIEREMIKI
jgi:fatty acid desaturase